MITNLQYIHVITEGCMDSPQTECLQWVIAAGGIKMEYVKHSIPGAFVTVRRFPLYQYEAKKNYF